MHNVHCVWIVSNIFSDHSKLYTYVRYVTCWWCPTIPLLVSTLNALTGYMTYVVFGPQRDGQNFSRWSVFKNDRVLFCVHMCVEDPDHVVDPVSFKCGKQKTSVYTGYSTLVFTSFVLFSFFSSNRLCMHSSSFWLDLCHPRHMRHPDATTNFTSWCAIHPKNHCTVNWYLQWLPLICYMSFDYLSVNVHSNLTTSAPTTPKSFFTHHPNNTYLFETPTYSHRLQ